VDTYKQKMMAKKMEQRTTQGKDEDRKQGEFKSPKKKHESPLRAADDNFSKKHSKPRDPSAEMLEESTFAGSQLGMSFTQPQSSKKK
jgi:hypothetical protein